MQSRSLADGARSEELALDSTFQGVRQLLLLDREMRSGDLADESGWAALLERLAFHDTLAGVVEEEIDAAVRTAASRRSRTRLLAGLAERVRLITGDLADVLAERTERPGFAGAGQ